MAHRATPNSHRIYFLLPPAWERDATAWRGRVKSKDFADTAGLQNLRQSKISLQNFEVSQQEIAPEKRENVEY